MEYLCILNAFEQDYYNRIKEIERLAAAAAVSPPQQPSSSSGSGSNSTSASSSSAASSTASSPTAVTAVAATAAAAASSTSSSHFPASFAHAAALAATQQQLQLQHRFAARFGQVEFPAQSPLFYQQQQQQQQQQFQQLPGAAHQQNNSNMANSLLWQPWRDLQQAAAMHHQLYKQQQQLQKESRLTSKELPTAKWRRERRQRAAAAEYQAHDAANDRERERERDRELDMDSPIDMSVTSSTVKHQRASPPPPYREPLGGSGSHCYAASRPSVITQAPPKREQPEHAHHHNHHHHQHSHSSREHDNRSTESVSICDIDEHFRRSLGPDYAALLKSPTSSSPTPSPQPQPQPVVSSGSGTPMQQISPQGYHRQQPTTYQQHHSPLPLPLPLLLPLPLSKIGLPVVHSPTLHSAPVSPQHELPPPQEEPLSLTPPPVRAASASALSTSTPPPPVLPATTSGASLILDMPVAKKERALDTPHHTPPRYNTPPPAYGSVLTSTSTPTPPTMPAIIRVKAEPGLAAASSTHTPPASPTSSTNISIFTKTEASVDDHFAKALGDTWKKLQGQGKE